MEISLSIEAHQHGSPLFTELSLYKPDGTRVRRSSSGGTAYDQDPVIDYTATAAGTWGILVQVDGGATAIGGSNLSWYVLDAWVNDDLDTGF